MTDFTWEKYREEASKYIEEKRKEIQGILDVAKRLYWDEPDEDRAEELVIDYIQKHFIIDVQVSFCDPSHVKEVAFTYVTGVNQVFYLTHSSGSLDTWLKYIDQKWDWEPLSLEFDCEIYDVIEENFKYRVGD